MQILIKVPVESLPYSTRSRDPRRTLNDQRLLVIQDKTHNPLRIVTPKEPRHLSIDAPFFEATIVIEPDAQHIRTGQNTRKKRWS